MEIELNSYYKGVINYKRVDNLKPEALPNGSDVHVCAMYFAEDSEKYAGQMILQVAENGLTLPQEDLIITEKCSGNDYKKNFIL